MTSHQTPERRLEAARWLAANYREQAARCRRLADEFDRNAEKHERRAATLAARKDEEQE